MPERIAVTGASGFIGEPLVRHLASAGFEVVRVGRASTRGERPDVEWDPVRGTIDAAKLQGITGAIHLAGEPIAQRWTSEVKRKIRDSRIYGTTLFARALASLEPRPRVMLSMSAIGLYGERGDEVLDEESRLGRGFLAEIGEAWERSADAARGAGIRVVHPRLGIVLSSEGGALAKMLPIFRMGAGGKVGAGRQWMSWVSRTDVVEALAFALEREAISGPMNVTSPVPVRNEEFTRALGSALSRPAVMPVPELAIRVLYGEMGVETVVEGQRVLPKKLQAEGFAFRYRTISEALAAEIR
jgi:uncharacterized protein